MLTTGKATKVTVYLSDGARHKGSPVYINVLDYLYKNGIAGATVLKGVAGFGAGHHIHTAHILELSDRLPIRIEFIDTAEKVQAVLPDLQGKCGCGLIEIQETNILVVPRS